MNYKQQIGDGNLPNKYWVRVSNDYSYKTGNEINWIGDLIPTFKSKGFTIAKPFKTYQGAKAYCDSLVLGAKISHNGKMYIVGRINIEDRLTGELYEYTTLFNPETGQSEDLEYEDYNFTQRAMENRGVKFV